MKKLVIITGVSWSWKTTLQNELINRGWVRPINFTTRSPRNEKTKEELRQNKADWESDEKIGGVAFTSDELDEYVFLTKKQFLKKLANGDFMESTNWYGNFYWVSKYLPKNEKVCVILDPVGRQQVMAKAAMDWWRIISFYIYIDEDEQYRRLSEERRSSIEDINERLKDNLHFFPTPNCILLNGETSIKTNCDIIEANFRKND